MFEKWIGSFENSKKNEILTKDLKKMNRHALKKNRTSRTVHDNHRNTFDELSWGIFENRLGVAM